jgi:serine/threonine protein kinase
MHVGPDRPVAVKVLGARLETTPEALARFQREGIAACRVRHPNAVAVLDYGVTAAGTAYLVMELLEGESLQKTLEATPVLSPQRSLEIIAPVCDVLTTAHAQGILHRDIKPANVFLHRPAEHETVKVVDFGTAKLVDEATTHESTRRGVVAGTPAYLAPERLANRPYDGRADVYSLGVTLYQMLTGDLPFVAVDGNLVTLALLHLHESPRPLRERNPEVPEDIDRIVREALAKDPTKRPPAGELGRRLRAAVEATSA